MSHDFEIRQQCQDLCVFEGVTLEKIAARMDLPVRTVEEWSRNEGWISMRKEYRRTQSEIRRKFTLYRLEQLKEAMRTLHPQAAFAVASLEQVAARANVKPEISSSEREAKTDPRTISTPEEAVVALQEAISIKINAMLTEPGTVSLKSVRELKDALALVEELKTKYRADDGKKGLTEETRARIEKEILGIG